MFSFDLDALVADVKEFAKRVHRVDDLVSRSSDDLKGHFEVGWVWASHVFASCCSR